MFDVEKVFKAQNILKKHKLHFKGTVDQGPKLVLDPMGVSFSVPINPLV